MRSMYYIPFPVLNGDSMPSGGAASIRMEVLLLYQVTDHIPALIFGTCFRAAAAGLRLR